MEDDRTKGTFKKLNKTSKIEEQILNIAWDIYHIKLIEQIMFHDNVGRKKRDTYCINMAKSGIAVKKELALVNME